MPSATCSFTDEIPVLPDGSGRKRTNRGALGSLTSKTEMPCLAQCAQYK